MWTAVFLEILDSSLMQLDVETRWLFAAMILLADESRTGYVDMPIENLAARAHLTVEQTSRALEELKRPDPTSRCQLNEGRRVVPMERPEGFAERGWYLPSWPEHRNRMRKTVRKEQNREASQRARERGASATVSNRQQPSDLKAESSSGGGEEPENLPTNRTRGGPLVEIWNRFRGALPDVRLPVPPDWVQYESSRLSEVPDLDRWRAAVVRVAASDFCNGGGPKKWRANFEFLVKEPHTLARIEEGRYDNRKTSGGSSRYAHLNTPDLIHRGDE